MDSRPLFLSSLLLILLLQARPSSCDPPTPAPAPSPDLEFIQETCKLTLYPDLCYSSLSRFASSLTQSSSEIARAALRVCLSESRFLSAYLSNLTRQDSSAALRDCSSTLSTAASQIRSSLKQMTQLLANDAGERQMRFQISNVQTWMSAAITNEDTCVDGFQSLPDCPLKSDVCDRVSVVTKLTSNALALVNFFASTLP